MELQNAVITEKEDTEEIIKITVTKEAGQSLTEILSRVNEGFEAGKVTRQDISSWIIERFKNSFTDSDIQSIRNDFFSERSLLESIVKQSRASGDVPDFLREALKKHWAVAAGSIKTLAPVNRRPARISQKSSPRTLNSKTSTDIGVENGKNDQ